MSTIYCKYWNTDTNFGTYYEYGIYELIKSIKYLKRDHSACNCVEGLPYV